MKENILALFVSLGILACLGCVILAFNEPAIMPPQGNVDKPINVSGDNQIKKGALGIGQGSVYWIVNAAGTLFLKNNENQEKLNIGQDGHIGIGTISPTSGVLLDVNGKTKANFLCLGKKGGWCYR